ncbi:MAG: Mov34/MPN/PAD-1 family protein [Novosphingobium sp.]
MAMALQVTRDVLAHLADVAARAHPRECCGILLGQGERISQACDAANVHATPETHFEIDPQALIDAHRAARSGGPEVLGYFHSHPDGPARPSATDRAMATGDGRIWAIHGADGVTFWRDRANLFEPLSYEAIDG